MDRWEGLGCMGQGMDKVCMDSLIPRDTIEERDEGAFSFLYENVR